MISHLLYLALFGGFVSLVFAVLLRDDPREQLRSGALMFGAFLAAALALGWLLFAFPL